MESARILPYLREASLEDGRVYLQAHLDELRDYAATGELLADEALKHLYNPFLSLKLAELLTYYGEITGSIYAHALGLKAKGDALVQIRHDLAAMESLDIAGEEFLQIGDEANWARSRISWMVAAAWQGRIDDAMQAAAQARSTFQKLHEDYWACVIDSNAAWIYAQVGRYQDALSMYKNMLDIFPTLTNQSETTIQRAIAIAEVNQAQILSWLGHFEKAYVLEQQAQAKFAMLNEVNLVINSEVNLANLDYLQGYYGSALQRYYKALDNVLQNAIDNPKLLAELKVLMATCLVKLNRVNEACQLAHESVEMYRKIGNSLQASNALREYAITLVAAGRLKEALAILAEAEVLFKYGNFDHHASAITLQRAELLLEMGEFMQAYEEASTIKAYFYQHNLVARSVRASLIIIGSLIMRAERQKPEEGLLEQAAKECKQVALEARQHHLQEEVYKSQYLLGHIFVLQGNNTKAIRHYTAALAQIERILNDLVFDLSPSFLHTAWKVFEDTIALCLQCQLRERAFSYLERARSIALRQYLKNKFFVNQEREDSFSSSIQVNRALTFQMQSELKTWQDQYRSYSTLLTHVDTSASLSIERGIIEAELKKCEMKLSELFERLYLQQATASFASTPKKSKKDRSVLNIMQLQRQLVSDQLLLAYFLYKENLTIFALNRNELVTRNVSDGVKHLKRLLPLLHAHLQPGGWADAQHPPQQAIRSMLNKLYDLLITPVKDVLPAQLGQLTIVPYGPLHTLPFHALHDGSNYLVEQFQVNYLPASSILTTSIKEMPTRLHPSSLLFGYSSHGHLQRAVEEAKTLSEMLQGHCYLDEEATIARLIEEAPESSIIHVATHGHSRLDAPNFSSILLADGRFNAIDAFGLNLQDCELVTLSGCETGLALIGGGDEQLGLGRAFLAAGAKSLVMSLWPVEDNATHELMQLFYQRLLRGDTKAHALQAAQCQLLHHSHPAYAHPYYWAAFRLVGDTAPLSFSIKEGTAQAQEIPSVKK